MSEYDKDAPCYHASRKRDCPFYLLAGCGRRTDKVLGPCYVPKPREEGT